MQNAAHLTTTNCNPRWIGCNARSRRCGCRLQWFTFSKVLMCVCIALCCSVLQRAITSLRLSPSEVHIPKNSCMHVCVAVRCSGLQREITSLRLSPSMVHSLKSPYVCMYCSVLQCAAKRDHVAVAVAFNDSHP